MSEWCYSVAIEDWSFDARLAQEGYNSREQLCLIESGIRDPLKCIRCGIWPSFALHYLHDNKNIWYQLNIVRYVQYKDRLWKHINIICLLLLCPDCCSSWELSEGGSDDTKLRTQMWKMCYFPSCPSAKRILKPGFSVFAFIRDSRFYFLD